MTATPAHTSDADTDTLVALNNALRAAGHKPACYQVWPGRWELAHQLDKSLRNPAYRRIIESWVA